LFETATHSTRVETMFGTGSLAESRGARPPPAGAAAPRFRRASVSRDKTADRCDRGRRRRMTVHFIRPPGPGATRSVDPARARSPSRPVRSLSLCGLAWLPAEISRALPARWRRASSTTAPLSLDEIMGEISAAAMPRAKAVARLHSGDLSVWSADGVSSFRRLKVSRHSLFGDAGRARPSPPPPPRWETELTLPGPGAIGGADPAPRAGRAPWPEGETLAAFCEETAAVLAIHLSVHVAGRK